VSETGELLEAAAEVARLAGEVALGYFRSGLAVETKGDGSPVTAADRAAEQVAREWIEANFPRDTVLGEEFGAGGEERVGGRRWLVDPIDGTRSFVAGVPLWGTLIAVTRGDEILAGAINCAASAELVVAAVGEGCWWNGSRARVSSVDSLAEATLLTTDERFPERPPRRKAWAELAAGARNARTWGDCFGYLLVATGRAEVMVDDKMNPWDSAALLPILEEAGGVLTDWKGNRTGLGGDTIATNRALDPLVRRALCSLPE
jgi:histidinol phosphatase-like enzyme (inositol monophosphatase family)